MSENLPINNPYQQTEDQIKDQIEGLRSDCPPYIKYIGTLQRPKAVVWKGKSVPISEYPHPDGWVLLLHISGPPSSPYSSSSFRILLDFDGGFPSVPPFVSFLSSIVHFAVNPNGELPGSFYEMHTQKHKESSLRPLLEDLYNFLGGPFHPCDNCNAAYASASKIQNERNQIISQYKPLRKHPELFLNPLEGDGDGGDDDVSLPPSWFSPEILLHFFSPPSQQPPLSSLLTFESPGVYSFPLFSDLFCDLFISEVEHYSSSGLPVSRPNTMNKYGVVVNHIGMEETITKLQKRILEPIAAILFPAEGSSLDMHHSFVVQYAVNQDLGLDMHTDDSDVTFNACLGKEFTGAILGFCGKMGLPDHRKEQGRYAHQKGRCVVHLGRRRHGAKDLTSGERFNLIIWNRSIAFRTSDEYESMPYHKEEGPPDLYCLSYTHDRDYEQYLGGMPPGKEEYKGKGWCPPPGKEHPSPSAEE